MAVVQITPVACLVPILVKAIVREVGPDVCRRRVIGKLRRDFAMLGDLPSLAGAACVLSSCCRNCRGCGMKDL